MINELYRLASTINNQGIATKEWHDDYGPLPKVSKRAPCIRLWLNEDGSICDLESLDPALVQSLRKFGNKQGTFPAFNIAPLYRIIEKNLFEALDKFTKKPALLNVDEIRSWCVQDNWRGSLHKKISLCLHSKSRELQKCIKQQKQSENSLILELIQIAGSYSNQPEHNFRTALENCVFQKLQKKEDVDIALALLFHRGNPAAKDPEKDSGGLSIILDLYAWQPYGYPVASKQMTEQINGMLLKSSSSMPAAPPNSGRIDAFGAEFVPVDKPMPSVRLRGFEVILRTMFAGQPCQHRYGTIENTSYPIARENRALTKKALEWIADGEREGVTWRRVDQKEIVFVYPSRLPKVPIKFASVFGQQQDGSPAQTEARFEQIAQEFIQTLRGIPSSEKPEFIQVFSVRKIDKARKKVVFTRNYTSDHMARAAEEWEMGCQNTPETGFVEQKTPFPLQTPRIVNNVWKQNGEMANRGKTAVERMKYYQVIELLLEPADENVLRNLLHILLANSAGLVKYIGNWQHGVFTRSKKAGEEKSQKTEIALLLSLIGLILYKCGDRKETYMKNMAYLFGQLLKISDELHAFYCKVVRGGSVPPQLVGSSLFVTASETPNQALAQLSVRMNPYITWAKQYRTKNIAEKGEESWRAGWYIKLYEEVANKLHPTMTDTMRFDDFGKAQFFIGYLASFPQKERSEEMGTNVANNMNEKGETDNEQGN
jgi:hypothetical protein